MVPALAVFAGIWTQWTSMRKVKEGETINVLSIDDETSTI